MSTPEWIVVALNVVAFIAMVMAFVGAGRREVRQETPQGDSDFPPLDYRQYRGYWD